MFVRKRVTSVEKNYAARKLYERGRMECVCVLIGECLQYIRRFRVELSTGNETLTASTIFIGTNEMSVQITYTKNRMLKTNIQCL